MRGTRVSYTSFLAPPFRRGGERMRDRGAARNCGCEEMRSAGGHVVGVAMATLAILALVAGLLRAEPVKLAHWAPVGNYPDSSLTLLAARYSLVVSQWSEGRV